MTTPVLDQVGSVADTGNVGSLTIPLTLGASADYLIVDVSAQAWNGAPDPTVTWNGVAMTLLAGGPASPGQGAIVYRRFGLAVTGGVTANVVVTKGGAGGFWLLAIARSFVGVASLGTTLHQLAAAYANTSTLTHDTPEALCVDAVHCANQNTMNPAAGQTADTAMIVNSAVGARASRKGGTGTVALTWTKVAGGADVEFLAHVSTPLIAMPAGPTWDPTQPAEDAALESAPVRDNFGALDLAVMAPLEALAVGSVLTKAAGPVLGGVAPGTNGHVLTLAGGVPAWSAPAGVTFPLLAPDGTAAAPSYAFTSAPSTGLFAGGLSLGGDIILARDAAGILAQRNGTNPQEFRLYETYTDNLNWSALRIVSGASHNIIAAAAGTGIARPLVLTAPASPIFIKPGPATWVFADDGTIYTSPTNSYDIGYASLCPRTIHAGTSVMSPVIDFVAGAAPATPATGHVLLYAKTDKKLYAKNDAGVETALW